ncbi:hypothetical protein BH11GEM2_BH11GEM2_35720 [soil metagenome]
MNPQLTTRLRTLRLSGMVEPLPARVAQAESAPLAHLDFLDLLVEDELARRADRLFDRRVKQANLTTLKTLADFDWHFNPKLPKAKLAELASARFVQTQRSYCTALIMSKIGRYMATTMPPTTTPRNTIITGSMSDSRFDTAASTSSS